MILKEKILISTVSADRSEEIREIFEPLGAVIVDFPMTEIHTAMLTDDDIRHLKNIRDFQWIIFTSRNGVKYFYDLLKKEANDTELPAGIKIATVGSRTSSELEIRGRQPDYTSPGNSVEDLALELLGMKSLRGCNILLPLGNLAPSILEEKLKQSARLVRINVYNTKINKTADNRPVRMIRNNNYSLVLLTSPSGVSGLADMLGDELVRSNIRAASIGKITSAAAERFGIKCLVTASRSTYRGLAQEIVNYYTINK